jgi:hypothetical protein
MKEDEIKYLKEYKLEIELYKIYKINIKEDSQIIQRFNKEIDDIYYLDDKLITRVLNEMKNWEKVDISKNKYYIGELENKKPNGIGILYNYDYEKNIDYIGYFKNGKYEGYGRKYDNYKRIHYLGYFSDNIYNGFGFLFDNLYIKYIGYFSEGQYNNYGKLFSNYSQNVLYQGFFEKGNRRGKGIIFYEKDFIYIKGLFNDKKINGILYDPDGNELYKGEFINERPKKGKNIKIYELNGEIKYEGDFLDGEYNGYGKLYEKDKLTKCAMIKYNGQFNKGIYHGLGKLYVDNYLGYYLYYDGNFNNNDFDGKGILF